MAKEKLTYDLVNKAVEMKSNGLSDCDIAAAIGVSKHTFSRWTCHPETKVQRTLSQRLKKTESEYKETLLNTIRAAAMAKNANWPAAAWLLEHKYPEEYSQNRPGLTPTEQAPKILLGVSVQPAGAAAIAGASVGGKQLLAAATSEGDPSLPSFAQVENVEDAPDGGR